MSNITPVELTILKSLWAAETLSAREIHETCESELKWSFSSTRTTLQRMVDKDLLKPNKSHGVTVYSAKVEKVVTLAAMVKKFVKNVLEISGPLPTSAFHDSRLFTKEEIAELELLLKEDTS